MRSYVLIQLPNVIDTISKRWRSKISLDFPAPEMELESVHVVLDVAICDAAPPGNIHQSFATPKPRYSATPCYSLNTVPKMGPPGGPIFGTTCAA